MHGFNSSDDSIGECTLIQQPVLLTAKTFKASCCHVIVKKEVVGGMLFITYNVNLPENKRNNQLLK